jgi:hypothetical protein
MLTNGGQGAVDVRIVFLVVFRRSVAVGALVAALGGFVVATDHAVAEAELAP